MSTELTIQNLVVKKYIKRAVSEPGILANTGNVSAEAVALLSADTWIDVSTQENSEIPSRSFDAPKALETFDAYQQCGDYDSTDATQRGYAGSALYRITLPAGASAAALTSIGFSATTSRFTEFGGKIETWRSSTSTPDSTWNITGSGVATALSSVEIGKTATYPGTAHITTDVLFEPVSDFATGDYLWILVMLDEYGGNRGYWIEGAIATALSTISVAVDATFTPTEIPYGPDPLGTSIYTGSLTSITKKAAVNILSCGGSEVDVTASVYSVDAFSGLNEAFCKAAYDSTSTSSGTSGELSLKIDLDLTSTPKTVSRNKLILSMSVPFKEVSGLTLNLYPGGAQVGLSKIRFSAISDYRNDSTIDSADIRKTYHDVETDMPNDFYTGESTYFLGTTEVVGAEVGTPIRIRLTKDIMSEQESDGSYRLAVLAVFEHLDSRDIALTSIGFPTGSGLVPVGIIN